MVIDPTLQLIVIIGIIIVALELLRFTRFSRSLTAKTERDVVMSHPIYRVAIRPNSYCRITDPTGWDNYNAVLKYDSGGFRYENESKVEPNLQEKNSRILIIGDSMVQFRELQLEDALPHKLEAILNQRIRKRVEVLSYAVGGWSPSLEYLYYKHVGCKFGAKIVIVCFFMNDVTEDAMRYKEMVCDVDGAPLAVFPKNPRRMVLDILSDPKFEHRSITWDTVQVTYHIIKERIKRSQIRRRFVQSPDLKERNSISENILAVLNETYSKEDEEAWKRMLSYLEFLNKEIRANDAIMVLVCIPYPVQIHPLQCGAMYKHWNVTERSIELAKPQSILRDFAERSKIIFVDLLPEFKKNGANEVYFFAAAAHPNEKGSQLMAEIVVSTILQNQELLAKLT